MNFKKSVKDYLVRPLFEVLNIDTYSRPALNNLDRKLEKYLDFNGGTFLEIGANDGFKQSNTYYYERLRNWEGILIEPIPILYRRCNKLRKKSEVFNYICGEPKDSGMNKTIRYAGLMSQVAGAMADTEKELNRIKEGLEIQNFKKTYEVEVECKTISEIIDMSKYKSFDFMSIDVEGFEIEVLKGIDMKRHAPQFLLVETWYYGGEAIKDFLCDYYDVEEYITEIDILFKLK
jgi:FkbM family methyltransferase